MTSSEPTDLRKRIVKTIARRSRSSDGATLTALAREAYDDLAAVLVPLVSQAGFDALVGRALNLAQREHPVDAAPAGDGQTAEPFGPVGLWLDRQDQRNSADAAAALFAALAGLLITLIGESLTTRYLQKAWPEGFSSARSKGKQA